ncbi:small GTP-binding protein domain protein [Legionella massiliensis]|uniref:Small GTP-binding protein domain protein n=1 Tax=Legionella massiliensis TaxID=1034943 RepID=A0A078L0T1_9GAMM|nr:ADP-ribosylation factor-like protein [Legionella massiliensis]CDZ78776.1 small GTP-binding protein domain protein [Legionella massiliensis]CEE14514.1 Ras family protein [Legionella massiliensis]
MTINITFFGAEGAGKTKLIKRMFNPSLPISIEPEPTIGGLFDRPVVRGVELKIWDVSGQERYRSLRKVFFNGADIAVYCVNLSLPINNDLIDRDIEEFRATNKEATLLLVGTKSDRDVNSDTTLASINNQAFAERFRLSSEDDHSLQSFFNILMSIGKQRLPMKVAAMTNSEVATTKTELFRTAKERLASQSALYLALESLGECAIDLPEERYKQLGQQAVILVEALYSSENNKQFASDIQAFRDNCYSIVKEETPYVKNLVLSVVAAAVVTVVVAALGFGIGFVLGAWAGPMAFLSAITTSYAAASIVIASGTAGTIAGLITAYGLFNQSTVETEVIDQVAEAASAFRLSMQAQN